MSSEIAVLDQGHRLRARACTAGEQRLRCVMVGALLIACGGGDAEGSASPPPSTIAPRQETPVAPASPQAGSEETPPDPGADEPTSRELLPSGAVQPPQARPAPAEDAASSNGSASDDDPDLACNGGQQTACLDAERVVICQSGQPIETTCNKLCKTYGLNSGPCEDGCQCGEPSNPACVLATEDFCACSVLTGADECAPETRDRLYLACHVNGIGGELMACTANFRATRPDAPVDEGFCADLNDTCQ